MPETPVADGEIVQSLLTEPSAGFDALYREYADRLFGYAVSVVSDRDLAADITHDALLKAVANVSKLRDPDRLRPWLFAITRNESISALRARSLWRDNESAIDMLSVDEDATGAVEAEESQALVADAMTALSPADRDALGLSMRNDLDPDEVAQAMGTTADQAGARLSRARVSLTAAVTALLLTRSESKNCPELAETLRGFDGFLSPLMRKRVCRHAKDCEYCTERGEHRAMAYVAAFSIPTALALPAGFRANAATAVSNLGSSAPVPDIGAVNEFGFPAPADQLLAGGAAGETAVIDAQPDASTAGATSVIAAQTSAVGPFAAPIITTPNDPGPKDSSSFDRRPWMIGAAIIAVLLMVGGGILLARSASIGDSNPTPVPSPSLTSSSPTPNPTETTPIPTVTATTPPPAPVPTPTQSPTPAPTPTPTPTLTPTPPPTPTPTTQAPTSQPLPKPNSKSPGPVVTPTKASSPTAQPNASASQGPAATKAPTQTP